MKIVKSLEGSSLLLKEVSETIHNVKRVSETIQNEAKEQKGSFLGMLLGTLGASYWEIC